MLCTSTSPYKLVQNFKAISPSCDHGFTQCCLCSTGVPSCLHVCILGSPGVKATGKDQPPAPCMYFLLLDAAHLIHSASSSSVLLYPAVCAAHGVVRLLDESDACMACASKLETLQEDRHTV